MKWSKESLSSLLKKDKLLIIFLLGILLFVVVLPVSDKKETEKGQLSEDGAKEQLLTEGEQETYKHQLEQELCSVLASVEGVGRVRVMITLASTGENVIKEDTQVNTSKITEGDSVGGTRQTTQSEEERTSVFTNENNASVPYVIKQKMPSVAGVVVVAEGGDNAKVVQNISEAVKALFDIEAHKIKVMKMNP